MSRKNNRWVWYDRDSSKICQRLKAYYTWLPFFVTIEAKNLRRCFNNVTLSLLITVVFNLQFSFSKPDYSKYILHMEYLSHFADFPTHLFRTKHTSPKNKRYLQLHFTCTDLEPMNICATWLNLNYQQHVPYQSKHILSRGPQAKLISKRLSEF